MGEKRSRIRNENKLTMIDYLRAGFQPTAERENYLQEKADNRVREEKERMAEEELLRREGEKRRRALGG